MRGAGRSWGVGSQHVVGMCFLVFWRDNADQHEPSILTLKLALSISTIGLLFCYFPNPLSLLCLFLLKGEPGMQGKKVKQEFFFALFSASPGKPLPEARGEAVVPAACSGPVLAFPGVSHTCSTKSYNSVTPQHRCSCAFSMAFVMTNRPEAAITSAQ